MNDLNWNDYFDNDRECGGFDDIEDDLELSIINAKSYINRKAKTKESIHLTACLERYIQECIEMRFPADIEIISRYERDIKAI